jgi:hypothetical protein
MQILRNLLQKTNSKPPLGRWTIERCNTKLDQKIDLANEDHCGPCGKYNRPANIKKVNESVNNIKSNYMNMVQLNIQKFMGISDIRKDMLTIDHIIDHNNHINQLNYLPVYFPAYKSPTCLPTYLPTYPPTYPRVVPRKMSKLDIYHTA